MSVLCPTVPSGDGRAVKPSASPFSASFSPRGLLAGGTGLGAGGDPGWATAGLDEGAGWGGGGSCSMQGPCTPFPSPGLGSPSAAGCTWDTHTHFGQPPPAPTTLTPPSTHATPGQTYTRGLPRPCAPRHDVTRCYGDAAASLCCSSPQLWDFRRGCVARAAGWAAGTPGGWRVHGCCCVPLHGWQQPLPGGSSLPVPGMCLSCLGVRMGPAGTGGGRRIKAMTGHEPARGQRRTCQHPAACQGTHRPVHAVPHAACRWDLCYSLWRTRWQNGWVLDLCRSRLVPTTPGGWHGPGFLPVQLPFAPLHHLRANVSCKKYSQQLEK